MLKISKNEFAHRSITRIDVHHTYSTQRVHLPLMSRRSPAETAPDHEADDLVGRFQGALLFVNFNQRVVLCILA
jgi:hypothetical protein